MSQARKCRLRYRLRWRSCCATLACSSLSSSFTHSSAVAKHALPLLCCCPASHVVAPAPPTWRQCYAPVPAALLTQCCFSSLQTRASKVLACLTSQLAAAFYAISGAKIGAARSCSRGSSSTRLRGRRARRLPVAWSCRRCRSVVHTIGRATSSESTASTCGRGWTIAAGAFRRRHSSRAARLGSYLMALGSSARWTAPACDSLATDMPSSQKSWRQPTSRRGGSGRGWTARIHAVPAMDMSAGAPGSACEHGRQRARSGPTSGRRGKWWASVR